ncbi:WXG100 family type VII secretion target [Streptomyces cavernicola]|uniref:ESAT-6-like protein n=1 Tax=Streptomyces cavernicola TaxID=3043613 RepID=A0ABT6SK72_9ACTN|nr:WXG100 family type VII secretion target [Streptomyces sp. B-S-A6]MDI3407651.1 WXG100 family type VII secretion target [Streptomyces sp. B-S-A6]
MAVDDGTMLVTYAELERAAQQISSQAKRLDGDLQALQTRMKDISAFFEGEAKTAADGLHREWDTKSREIHQALNAIANAVREASAAYSAADRKAAANY